MKLSKIALICFSLLAVLTYSCKPDNVKPNTDADLGAFSSTGVFNGEGSVHVMPSPGCDIDITGQMAIDYFGQSYPLPGTEFVMVNDESDMYISIKAMAGWGFSEVAMDAVPRGQQLPTDTNGKTDHTKFTSQDQLATASSWYMWKIPMNELEEWMTYCACAKMVNSTNPNQTFNVWLNGKPVAGAGGFTVDYQLGLQNCPTACEPWLGATNNPCLSVPPCAVPTPAPGDDLSAYACGNPKAGKVTVCHLPPGNPANMQEICISTSALPAHVVDFKPASNPCMGHHSGCHIGPCDPCGAGSTADYAASLSTTCNGN